MPKFNYSELVTSVYMEPRKGSHLRPSPDHFRLGLERAKTLMKAPPARVSPRIVVDSTGRRRHAKTHWKTNPLPTIDSGPRPLVPKMPNYESYKCERLETLMHKGASERSLRIKSTMRADQSFLHDKRFLDMLLQNTGIRTRADIWVRDITRDALEFIDTRNIYWRQKTPDHVMRASKSVMQQVKVKKQPQRTQTLVDSTMKEMKRIYTMMKNQHYNRAIKAAKQLTEHLSRLDKPIPGQEHVLANCACILGNAYLEKRDEKKALAFHMQDYQIGTDCQILMVRSRALDNLGRVYARVGQFQKAIHIWSEKLASHEDIPILEKVWLQHEMGYCHLKSGSQERARECGEEEYSLAKEIGDRHWQLNASMLIAQAMMVRGDVYGCKQAFDRALRAAVKAGDNNAEKTLVSTLNDLDTAIDSYKEREYTAISRISSPAAVTKPVYRGDSRLKNKSPRHKQNSSRSSSTMNFSDTARTGHIRLTPLDRCTDSEVSQEGSRSHLATPVSEEDTTDTM